MARFDYVICPVVVAGARKGA
ncbi:hypothetical protein STRTUCAR8_00552, partial [Streptomyces turgidiscabies Car8]